MAAVEAFNYSFLTKRHCADEEMRVAARRDSFGRVAMLHLSDKIEMRQEWRCRLA